MADNDQTVQQLIDNLNIVVATLAKDGGQFSGAIDRLERLVSGLSDDRDTIGAAIDALNNGTASLADLLTNARPPLSGTIDQLSRLAPILDNDKDRLDAAIAEGAEELSQAGPTRRIRRHHPVLPLRVQAPWHGSSGQDGDSPLVQVRRVRKVHGTLMLKYRGAGLIKAGFIGAVLIVLVILVGLSPDRLSRWRQRSDTRRCFPKPAALRRATP